MGTWSPQKWLQYFEFTVADVPVNIIKFYVQLWCSLAGQKLFLFFVGRIFCDIGRINSDLMQDRQKNHSLYWHDLMEW